MLCRGGESPILKVSRRLYKFIDRGFAFSQESGQAPQITNNVLKKLREGFSARFSFAPGVRERTDSYRPNPLSTVNDKDDGQEVLKGSFNPDYIMTN